MKTHKELGNEEILKQGDCVYMFGEWQSIENEELLRVIGAKTLIGCTPVSANVYFGASPRPSFGRPLTKKLK